MNTVTLRKAGSKDNDFTYFVKKVAFRQYVEQVWGWDEEEQRQLHERRFRSQDFRIVNLAGTDVGIIAVVMTSDCIKVNQLFFLPEHQGKGVGRKCMSLIIEEAHRLSLPVKLRVLKVNLRAQAFFKKLGFVCIGETNTHILMRKNS